MSITVYYNKNYNIDLGIINKLHPFDGLKFEKVAKGISNDKNIVIESPAQPISEQEINGFVDSLQELLLKKKGYILRALEIPSLPLIPFSWFEKKVLIPMRWAVAGTLSATKSAFSGINCWNLAGGYHHASRAKSEGFCIYNDIGITLDNLRRTSLLDANDNILIIDVDAHHGNGNAYTFLEDRTVTLFDIYNNDIYPNSAFTKERVDINVPLKKGTGGEEYIVELRRALDNITGNYKIAFVIAGTDVLDTDPLGGLNLSIDDCASRDFLISEKLSELSIPYVFLGGGGYSKDSANAMVAGIAKVCAQC